MTTTYQITVTGARPFCAAVVIEDGIVVEAAPILRTCCMGCTLEQAIANVGSRFGAYDGHILHWRGVTWREV